MRRLLSSPLARENRRRLIKLGLPGDLFSVGFWEREAQAREREVALLSLLEALWVDGNLPITLPWEVIFKRWRASLASPFHFSSYGDRPRWIKVLNDAGAELKCRRTGQRKRSWAKAAKVQHAKEVAARLAAK